MSQEFLDDRRRALEESFFRKRNTELLERLKRETQLEARRNELARASGIHDEKLLERLLDMDLGTETVAALSLVPMVRVAWADNKLEQKERDAILQAAIAAGLEEANPSYHWLVTWLNTPPDETLVAAWNEYVSALMAVISDDDREALRNDLTRRARDVAAAAGSILGLTDPVSAAENVILEELDEILSKH